VQPRHPIGLAQQALSVQAVCGGRLSLGLGVSHHWVIDEMVLGELAESAGGVAAPAQTPAPTGA
jgi:alkanesulfonate monooxygenase SsuD/methylene tetrahydromethanopterin reductase-like flavin-dependent oxidoreductase (luciferase family)